MSGKDLKAEGIERALGNPEAAPWRAEATRRLLTIIRAGQPDPFTSEDVTRVVGQPPHPNQVGALFNAASRRGWVKRAGFRNADRENQHAALISEWTATEAGRRASLAGAPPPAPTAPVAPRGPRTWDEVRAELVAQGRVRP